MADRLVIYHGNCFDGFTAAWVHARHSGESGEYIAAHHGDAPPDVTGRDVLVLDFSYPRAELLAMNDAAASLQVLDHHKSAEEALRGLPFCAFDMDRSGCGMTWDFLMPGHQRPQLVNIMEDRDLWRFKYEATGPVIAAAGAVPMTFEAWDQLAGDIDGVIGDGEAILRYIRTVGERVSQQAVSWTIGEHSVPVVNIAYPSASDHLALLLAHHPEAPFVASFCLGGDSKWHFSLRSRSTDPDHGFDVSVLAGQYGGGGHRNAAGFVLITLDGFHPA